jgi:hypothetical protein
MSFGPRPPISNPKGHNASRSAAVIKHSGGTSKYWRYEMYDNPYDYENRVGIHPISWEDFHGLCKGLVAAIATSQPEIILPIGRGGYYPGTLIAYMLQVELYPIRLSRRVNDAIVYRTPKWTHPS